MHKLMEYICDELEELERKAEKEGKLSMAEIQYGDTLAHMKKNLLKADEMWDGEEYSGRMYYDDGGRSYARRGGGRSNRSYARGRGRTARRDAMGRYSGDTDGMVEELRDLMQDAPDEQTRTEFQRFINKIEQMR